MKLPPRFPFGVLPVLLFLPCLAVAAGDREAGRQVYAARCAACHTLDYPGVGPAHRGVVGRPIGKAPGFEYSPALRNAKGIWTEAALARWLTDPEEFLPGQRMGIRLESAQERADVIEFLKSLPPRE